MVPKKKPVCNVFIFFTFLNSWFVVKCIRQGKEKIMKQYSCLNNRLKPAETYTHTHTHTHTHVIS